MTQDWIDTAHLAADAARAVTRRWFRRSPPVSHKAAASPIVTLADQQSEAAMRAIIRSRHPTHGIHGEEEADVVGEPGAPVWVLDPIDGTIAFASGKPLFTTLIALTVAGETQVGVVDQSVTGERWLGVRGVGATLNGEPVRASGQSDLTVSRLSSTTPSMFTAAQAAAFERLSSRVHVTSWGGDAYSYALLATGTVDLVVEVGLSWYDWAPLTVLVEASGGVITDWQGRPLRPGDADVVAAASPALHAAALAALQG